MSQHVVFQLAGELVRRELPDPDVPAWNDVTWGEHYCLFTPSYWVSQIWMNQYDVAESSPYRSQRSLAEEIAFCMLSGFGITAELAGAAFQACRGSGLIERLCTDPEAWSEVLRTPLSLNGRAVRYRYPKQKAKFLADAMSHLAAQRIDSSSGIALRNSLLKVQGCGRKTAGFIARNYLDSDEVAILDIHVIRACLILGVFSEQDKVETCYEDMEQRYLGFCRSIGVRPSVLDCVLWSQMRTLGACAIEAVKFKFGHPPDQAPRVREPRQLTLAI